MKHTFMQKCFSIISSLSLLVQSMSGSLLILMQPSQISAASFSWPTEAEWVSYRDLDGFIVSDYETSSDPTNGGAAVQPSEIDIASGVDKSGSNPGTYSSFEYYYNSNGTIGDCSDDMIFFRTRLAADPRVTGGSGAEYSSYHWDVLFNTDADSDAEYVLDLFGNKSSGSDLSGTLGLYTVTPGSHYEYNPDDPANVIWNVPAVRSDNEYTRVEGITYNDTDDSNDNYWIEVALPLYYNGNPLLPISMCGNTDLTGDIFASTAASNTDPLQKDWMSGVAFFIDEVRTKSVVNPTQSGNPTTESSAVPGDVLIYTLTVTNNGTLESLGYVIQDDISDVLEYADITNLDYDGNTLSGSVTNGVISWLPQDLGAFDDPNNTISEQFSVTIKPADQWLTTDDFILTNVFGNIVNVYLPEPYCGDEEVNQTTEECDGTAGVGEHQECSAECTLIDVPYCGDEEVNQTTEECDGTAGVGEHQECSAECTLIDVPYCGDEEVNQTTEECDGTAGVGEHQECSAECTLIDVPYCGDEEVNQTTEECDGTAGVGEHQECSAECTLIDVPYCGDEEVNQTTEECDGTAGVGEHQECSAECTLIDVSYCGDGTTDEGETCDDGNVVDGDGCSAICTIEEEEEEPICGDGTVDEGETCDDGNTTDGDGCSSSCTTEEEQQPVCGNNIKETGEECDGTDGVTEGYTCSDTCTLDPEVVVTVCGNDVKETGEECDGEDGVIDGYQCSATCELETDDGDVLGENVTRIPTTLPETGASLIALVNAMGAIILGLLLREKKLLIKKEN